MQVVHKFQLPAPCAGTFNLPIPGFVRALSAQAQGDEVVLYALIDTGNPPITIQICVTHTGEGSPPDDFNFLDTVMLLGGDYVLHVFWKVVG